eukprot:c24369_g1_i1 orf=182-1945(-)
MPSSWLSWKRSLACKPQPGDVHDPQSLHGADSRAKVEAAHAVFEGKRLYMRSGCSRSIANLRDVIHSSRRMDGAHMPAGMPNFSPKSVESNDFVQCISPEAMLQEHGCDPHLLYKHSHHRQPSHSQLHGKLSLDDIVATHHPHPFHHHQKRSENANATTRSFYGTPLHPSARPSARPDISLHHSQGAKSNSFRKLSGCYDCKNPAVSLVVYKTSAAATTNAGANGDVSATEGSLPPVAPKAVCQRCGDAFPKYEALEQHHLLKHAVAELEVGDSSRNVVEIIFRTSWLRLPEPSAPPGTAAPSVSASGQLKIERVLKVNNLARTLARFEDYREGVKVRASKLPKKHPRCLADGNELLRFYGARLECELVQAGREGAGSAAAATCTSASCTICRIIRTGFPRNRGPDGAANRGILTTATSGRAHQLMVDPTAGVNNILSPNTHMHVCPKLSSREEDTYTHLTSKEDTGCRRGAIVGAGGEDGEHIVRPNHWCNNYGNRNGGLMAMLVCRVIAGRILKPPQTTTTAPPTPPHSGDLSPLGAGFDSVAGGEMGANGLPPPGMGQLHSRFEEVTVFNSRAILPCFVVLYRC